MRKNILFNLTIGIWFLLFLTGCTFFESKPQIDPETAKEATLSYLNDKYHEEFEIISDGLVTDSILGGEVWYRCVVVKQEEQAQEKRNTYAVCIMLDGESYQVVGETYHYSFVKDIVSEYLEAVFSQCMKNVDFIYYVPDLPVPGDSKYEGYTPDHVIPENMNDVEENYTYQRFECYVILPESSAGNLESSIDRITKELKKEELYNNNVYFYIVFRVMSDETYQDIISSDDPQQKWLGQIYGKDQLIYEYKLNTHR